MTRGEIWWVDFGLAFGSMAMGRRPALIVQNDNFNASNIASTVVVPLTTNTLLAEHRDNILLPKRTTKLPKDSVVLIPQIGSVDKACLIEKVSKLSPATMLEVSHALSDFLRFVINELRRRCCNISKVLFKSLCTYARKYRFSSMSRLCNFKLAKL